MTRKHPRRRDVLRVLGAGLVAPALLPLRARAASPTFGPESVVERARLLARQPYEAPAPVPRLLAELDYDAYRTLRFRKREAIWGASKTRFSIELFAPGFLYERGVELTLVENTRARPIGLGTDAFETPDPAVARALADFGRFAGFRLHYPINRDDYRDEFVVFQGASYFRAVSRGQQYGLSARGLAIDVAEPTGEEFPLFRAFWIERPAADARAIVVHALLDGPGCTGAYRFAIYPGGRTTMDVDATLFARRAIGHVGFAPLTSMFLHGPMDPPEVPDQRPAVHDSLGLAMHSGRGEWIWRPLTNPRSLQVSAFLDRDPKGFGLIQRERDFAAYQDLEARYDLRPSAWVEPRGPWGPGQVTLVEIPTDIETNDNVVAYWRPESALPAGVAHRFAYRLTWPDDVPTPQTLARVVRTARGRTFDGRYPQIAIDLRTAPAARAVVEGLEVLADASAGRIVETIVQPNPFVGGARVFVTFDPLDAAVVELRVRFQRDGLRVAESCFHRWLRR